MCNVIILYQVFIIPVNPVKDTDNEPYFTTDEGIPDFAADQDIPDLAADQDIPDFTMEIESDEEVDLTVISSQ